MSLGRDLAHYVQVYDDALPAALCGRMIASFHQLERHQRRNGRGHRAGLEASAWTELDVSALSDPGFQGMLLDNMQRHWQRYIETVKLTIPVPFSPRTAPFIIKRYQPGGDEGFQAHFDSIGAVANRYLVFLWYLNDVDAGGETRFVDLDIAVTPRAGRLVMFPPYWMFQHQGEVPVSGDKYILSTYLLF